MADRLVVILNGQIVETGAPEMLYRQPKMLYTAQLLCNRTLLTDAEAQLCGIEATKDTVCVSPEHVLMQPVANGIWKVKQVLFKGFFEDVILQHNNIQLRALNLQKGKYKPGDSVSIRIEDFVEY